MTKGRKPMPRNLRLVRGDVRPCRDNADEPVVEVSIPEAPDYLQDQEADVFQETATLLARMRVMTDVDVPALAMYASRFCVWREANDNVRATGLVIKSSKGFPIQNPYLAIANRAQADCIKILTEFGMTPSSRTRVRP